MAKKIKPVEVTIGGEKYLTKSLSCDKCGEPLTHSNQYGMFCDKECELEASKQAKVTIDKILTAIGVK